MRLACGTDLVSIARIRTAIENPHFINRVFTKEETVYCTAKHDPAQHFAARFAAKEAVAKALGTGIADGVTLPSIEVVRTKTGAPEIQLHEGALRRYEAMGGTQIAVSLSHTEDAAMAFVVLAYEK